MNVTFGTNIIACPASFNNDSTRTGRRVVQLKPTDFELKLCVNRFQWAETTASVGTGANLEGAHMGSNRRQRALRAEQRTR